MSDGKVIQFRDPQRAAISDPAGKVLRAREALVHLTLALGPAEQQPGPVRAAMGKMADALFDE